MGDLRVLVNGEYFELEGAVLYFLSQFSDFISLEKELLKAVAVLLRSNLCRGIRNLGDGEKISQKIDKKIIEELDLETRRRLEEVVNETEGIIVKYNGKIVDFYYTKNCSGGTANSEDILGTNIAYLRKVLCNHCQKKHREIEIDVKDIENKYGVKDGNYKSEIENLIDDVERDETGRIKNLSFRKNKTSGKEFTEKMNLKSNRLYFMQRSIAIKEIGEGLGLGICIEGGNNLALEGKKFDEIIKYYYTGVDIIKIDKEYIKNYFNEKKIVIDAGHGGSDFGKVNEDLIEKDINLAIAKRLKELLENKGCHVFLTRKEDEYVSLLDRVNLINNVRPDFFISIHQNSFINDTVNGSEGYCFKDDEEAIELATIILRELSEDINSKNRGVRVGDYYILREGKVSGIVLECLYITGNIDKEKYKDDGIKKIAYSIFRGICEYFDVRV